MRILQVMAGAKVGGAEAFFERLTRALHHAGMDEHAVIRGEQQRMARLAQDGVGVTEAAFGGPFDFATRATIRRVMRAFQPDVTLVWMNRAAAKTPHPGKVIGKGILAGRLGGYYDLKYYRHCDHLIGNTRGIVDYLIAQGWPKERAHYLPNFVDEAPSPPQSRAALATDARDIVILALGRLHTNKAFDIAIRAIALVPGAVLWLAGEGPERARLAALAQEAGVAGRIRFLGWRSDVAALLAAADILVCPSRHEPLGNVIVEAFAHRVPIVAAASEGPRELIGDGVDGVLVPVDDVDALAAALCRLCQSKELRRSLSAAGRARYEQAFTEQAVVGAYRAFFEKITTGKVFG